MSHQIADIDKSKTGGSGGALSGDANPKPQSSSRVKLKARIRAASIHLAISSTIAIVLVLLVNLIWYPAPLFELAKGRDIFLILISCDITLGPVMTLVIFNIRKPRAELIRDVSIIAVVQFSAMVYGIFTILEVRPAYIVFNVAQFNVPLASELVNADNIVAPAGSGGLSQPGPSPVAPWFGPKIVGAKIPDENEERSRLLFAAVGGRGDVFQMPHYFVAYELVKSEVVGHARTPTQIAKELNVSMGAVDKATEEFKRKRLDFRLLPLVIRSTTALAVVDAHTGDFLGIASVPHDF